MPFLERLSEVSCSRGARPSRATRELPARSSAVRLGAEVARPVAAPSWLELRPSRSSRGALPSAATVATWLEERSSDVSAGSEDRSAGDVSAFCERSSACRASSGGSTSGSAKLLAAKLSSVKHTQALSEPTPVAVSALEEASSERRCGKACSPSSDGRPFPCTLHLV